MKKLFLAFIFVLFFFGTAQGKWLAADKPTGSLPIASEVKVNGTVVEGIVQISQDGLSVLLLDLTSLGPGKHQFEARWEYTTWGWSEWSGPFDAEKPPTPLLKIVED